MQAMQAGGIPPLLVLPPGPHDAANHRAIRRASGFGPLSSVWASRGTQEGPRDLIQTPCEMLRRPFFEWGGTQKLDLDMMEGRRPFNTMGVSRSLSSFGRHWLFSPSLTLELH